VEGATGYQTRSVSLDITDASGALSRAIRDPTVADGILDRLSTNAQRIELRGDSIVKSGPKWMGAGQIRISATDRFDP